MFPSAARNLQTKNDVRKLHEAHKRRTALLVYEDYAHVHDASDLELPDWQNLILRLEVIILNIINDLLDYNNPGGLGDLDDDGLVVEDLHEV